eukprot:scaffold443_cov527-Prasinococcus_capsulatus_cf.AAC.16
MSWPRASALQWVSCAAVSDPGRTRHESTRRRPAVRYVRRLPPLAAVADRRDHDRRARPGNRLRPRGAGGRVPHCQDEAAGADADDARRVSGSCAAPVALPRPPRIVYRQARARAGRRREEVREAASRRAPSLVRRLLAAGSQRRPCKKSPQEPAGARKSPQEPARARKSPQEPARARKSPQEPRSRARTAGR